MGKAEEVFHALILQPTEILRLVFILNLHLVQLRNLLKFDKTDHSLITQTNDYTRRNSIWTLIFPYTDSSEITKT